MMPKARGATGCPRPLSRPLKAVESEMAEQVLRVRRPRPCAGADGRYIGVEIIALSERAA